MANTYPEDLKNIKDNLTYREMFKEILSQIEQSNVDRADDRDLLSGFIDEFKASQKLQDEKFAAHVKDYNDIVTPSLVRVGTFVKIVTWVGTVMGGGVIALILGILTGQVKIVMP